MLLWKKAARALYTGAGKMMCLRKLSNNYGVSELIRKFVGGFERCSADAFGVKLHQVTRSVRAHYPRTRTFTPSGKENSMKF